MGRRCIDVRMATAVSVLGFLMGCGVQSPPKDELAGIRAAIPAEVAGWQRGEAEIYDTETIFSYIDGHAEVYLSYGMKRCLAVRYTASNGEGDIVLDLYEQASSADAFGVYSYDREGADVEIGQGAVQRPGWLSFWKGHWYGSVYAEGESASASEAVLAIGRAAAEAITGGGAAPALVGDLPSAGLDTKSVRYLHAQEILNGVVYIGFDNVFGLVPETDAVLGRYDRDEGSGWLMLVQYPQEIDASRAELGAREAGLIVRRNGSRLVAVLEPKSDEIAEILLGDAMGGSNE